jgi:hypothetical protein
MIFSFSKKAESNCRHMFSCSLMPVISGMAAIHPNSLTPVKKTKLHPLDKEQKHSNRMLSRKRIVIEHIFCKLKVFRSPLQFNRRRL